ncbi:MAG: ribosome maturation factor RimP [Culicoidibacterales bacterium]
MSLIIEKTRELVQPILEAKELTLYDIEYVQEGRDFFLRIYIDGPNGIDLDMCVDVSESLSIQLDEADYIEDVYFLEVSSPGAERPLRSLEDVQDAVGEHVYVKVREKVNGIQAFQGDLVNVTETGDLTIEYLDKTRRKVVTFPYTNVKKARLAIKF